MAGHQQQNQWSVVSCESVFSLLQPPPHQTPSHTLCHLPQAQGVEAGADPRALEDGQCGQLSPWLLHPELNCVVMAGELLRASAVTLPCASWVEIVWKSRQTFQLSKEPHFLKLPSTATTRSDQTEALEASQWCQASTSASLANSSWCQQRNKALLNWGWSRVETVSPCCRALPKRCRGDHSDNSKGTGLERMCYSCQMQAPVRETSQPTEKSVYFPGHIYHAEKNYRERERVVCVCISTQLCWKREIIKPMDLSNWGWLNGMWHNSASNLRLSAPIGSLCWHPAPQERLPRAPQGSLGCGCLYPQTCLIQVDPSAAPTPREEGWHELLLR